MGIYSRETVLGYVESSEDLQVSFSLGNRRSGTKRKITELSEDGVLVVKPRKGLRKHFHSVVPTCSCRLKKTGNAKLHQKDFEKKGCGNKTESNLI